MKSSVMLKRTILPRNLVDQCSGSTGLSMVGPWTLSMDCGRGRRGFDKRRFVHGRGRRGFDNRRFVHGQLNIRMSMDTFETSMDLQV